MPAIRPYESPALQFLLGPALRPGGLSVTQRAAELCDFSGKDRVVDLGCGLGATVDFLSRREIDASGLDCSASMLAKARSRYPSARLVRADADRLPFRSEILDGVFCECVFSLLRDPVLVLAEVHRVLVGRGRWALSDLYLQPQSHPPTPAGVSPISCLAGARLRPQMDLMLQDAGFSILAWEDHTDRLKHLAAELVFAGIPLSEFFAFPSAGLHLQMPLQDGKPAKPGFALWILQKESCRG